MDSSEVITEPIAVQLVETDQQWLASFGVDPSWQDDPNVVAELNELIVTGSHHLTGQNDEQLFQETVAAREKFLTFAGLSQSLIEGYRTRRPSLVPVDTFIRGQRAMLDLGLDASKVINASPSTMALRPEILKSKHDILASHGLDAVKIINLYPSLLTISSDKLSDGFDNLATCGLDVVRVVDTNPVILSYATESIEAKLDNLTQLGLNAVKVAYAYPSIIGANPETVKAKLDNLTQLGLNAVKVANAFPMVIGTNSGTIEAKLDNLTQLGLNAVKVANEHPSTLGANPETVKAKLDKLASLGLDSIKVVNSFPTFLGLSLESIKARLDNFSSCGLDAVALVNRHPASISITPQMLKSKLILLERTAEVLGWDFSSLELVNEFPPILSFSRSKIKILRRIAAEYLRESARNTPPSQIKSALIQPLEYYILALSNNPDKQYIVKELRNKVSQVALSATERKGKARVVAESGILGRIGAMYLDYAS